MVETSLSARDPAKTLHEDVVTWTRRYAGARVVPMLIRLLVYAVLAIGIGLPARMSRFAAASGHDVVAFVSLTTALAAAALLVYLTLVPLGRRSMSRFVGVMSDRIYGAEGRVTLEGPVAPPAGRGKFLVGIAFALCILGSIYLESHALVPPRYSQPLTALYVIPVLLYLGRSSGRMAPAAILWAGLTAFHAALTLAGVTWLIDARFTAINRVVSTFGFGLLSALVVHLYSRYALKRLRSLVRE